MNTRLQSLPAPWLFAILLGFATSTWAQEETETLSVPSGHYSLEKTHAYIAFSYSHLGFSNPILNFRNFEAELDIDGERPEASKLKVEIDANSIDSGTDIFDKHLKAKGFFHVKKHPKITFASTAIEHTGGNNYTLTGDLTLKGVTQPVTLQATLNKVGKPPGIGRKLTLGFSARGSLSRSAWKMGKYAPNVGDEVNLVIETEFVKARKK